MMPPSAPDRSVAHLDEDTCLDLLHGLLPSPRREQVVAHVKTCASCESLLRGRVAERERVRAVGMPASRTAPGRARSSIEAAADVLPSSPRPAPVGTDSAGDRPGLRDRFRALVRPAIAVPALAAVAVVAIVAVFARQGAFPPALTPRWLPPAGSMMVQRAQSSPEDRELALGLGAYARRDLGGAIRHLEAARSPDSNVETMRTVYLASALAASGDHREAAAALDTLRWELVPDPWSSETQWTYWLALRGSNQKARADSLLRELARDPGEIGERARAARR